VLPIETHDETSSQPTSKCAYTINNQHRSSKVAKYPHEFSFELIDPEKVFGQMFNVGHGQSRGPLHVAA
jgi:hypothetical protein